MTWHFVAKTSDLQEGEGVMCPISGRPIGLWKWNGRYHAMDDRCPHRGALLSEGECKEGIVTCPWHAWQFDLQSGAYLENPDIQLKVYPVKEEGDKIFIQVGGENGENLRK